MNAVENALYMPAVAMESPGMLHTVLLFSGKMENFSTLLEFRISSHIGRYSCAASYSENIMSIQKKKLCISFAACHYECNSCMHELNKPGAVLKFRLILHLTKER